MTYGVDECRVCGVPIQPYGRDSYKQYLESLKKPTMPEREWRAKGYLAMPTRLQMHNPHIGCCLECADRELKRQGKYAVRGFIWLALFVSFWAFIIYVYSYARH